MKNHHHFRSWICLSICFNISCVCSVLKLISKSFGNSMYMLVITTSLVLPSRCLQILRTSHIHWIQMAIITLSSIWISNPNVMRDLRLIANLLICHAIDSVHSFVRWVLFVFDIWKRQWTRWWYDLFAVWGKIVCSSVRWRQFSFTISDRLDQL